MEETSKKVRHTSGPWRISNHGQAIVENPAIKGHQIAIETSGGYVTMEERIANARLIASAPSLLEALEAVQRLKQLLEYPREVSEAHVGEAMAVSAMISKVEEAIKLAKGEIKTELI